MKRGTSTKPLILGILGLISALPNALITLLSSDLIMNLSDNPIDTSSETPIFYMKLVFWSAIIGFAFSLFSKRLYKTAGLVMLICGFMLFISMITGNLFLIFPASFFLLGGTICFSQKKVIKNKVVK